MCMKQKSCGNITSVNEKITPSEKKKEVKKKFDIKQYFFLLFRYNKLARTIRDLAKRVSDIDASEPFRTEASAAILEKLYILGLIPTKWDLNNAVKISASSFCRRRLPIVMVRSRFNIQYFNHYLMSTKLC